MTIIKFCRVVSLGFWLAVLPMAATGADPSGSAWPGPITDKTLVAWVYLSNLTQQAGSVLTIQTPAEDFDAIVFGELAPRKWMAGSELHHRTERQQAANPDESADMQTLVQIAISYAGKQVTVYRDGQRYARHEIREPFVFDDESIVLMGLRHLGSSVPNLFAGAIEEARLYNVALDGPALAALRTNQPGSVPPFAQWTFEQGKPDDRMGRFGYAELRGGAVIADGKLHLDGKGACLVARRAKPWSDTHKSFIHYRPATGNLGDTIAFFWKGEHHIFYLHESRWDHIVSTDLVHWRELPSALTRGDDPLGPDGEACWTGSVVEHSNTFHLFYTGKNMRDPAGDQKVMMATSQDLIHWEKQPSGTFYADGKHYWSKPVNGSADSMIYHHQAFRDPDVFWHEREKQWWMLLHALTAGGRQPCIGLYTSRDLRHWTPHAPLATYNPGVSLDCPHAAPIQGRWFIIAADTSYTAAPAPGGPYPAGMQPYDSGDLFVPKSLFDGKRRILWGWIRDLQGGRDHGQGLWGGTMSMAREIFPDDQGRLCSRPPAEVTAAFTNIVLDLSVEPPLSGVTGDWRYEGPSLACGDQGGACRFDVSGDYMLQCVVRLDPQAELTVVLRQQDTTGAGYRLILRPRIGQVELQRGTSRFARPVELDTSKPITLQAFVQDSIVECFINDRQALTCRAYDYRQGKLGLSVTGGKAQVLELKIKTREGTK